MSSANCRIIVRAWPCRLNQAHNPFQSLLANAVESSDPTFVLEEFSPRHPFQAADLWHWHWPEALLNGPVVKAGAYFGYLLFLMQIARLRRIPIVWTAHNIASHTGYHPRLERMLRRSFVRRIAAVHYLSESSRKELSQLWPRLSSIPSAVTNHGIYPVVRAAPLPTTPPDVFVVGFIGKISAYKGLPELVSAFNALPDPNLHLLVAGQMSLDFNASATPPQNSARQTWMTQLLTEAQLSAAYAATDLVVLPYRAVTNSGSLMYALTAGKRVLAPAIGAIPEIASTIGEGWITTYHGTISPEILGSAISKTRMAPKQSYPDLSCYQWDDVAVGVASLYRATTGRRLGPVDDVR